MLRSHGRSRGGWIKQQFLVRGQQDLVEGEPSQNMYLSLQSMNLGAILTAESDSGAVGSWLRSLCSCIEGSGTFSGVREPAGPHHQEGGNLGREQNENGSNRH